MGVDRVIWRQFEEQYPREVFEGENLKLILVEDLHQDLHFDYHYDANPNQNHCKPLPLIL